MGKKHKTEDGVIAAVIDGPACRREWNIALEDNVSESQRCPSKSDHSG